MKTRLLETPSQSLAPKNAIEWHRLMTEVLTSAQTIESRHLPGLRLAVSKGQTEQALRRLGIICQADIEREFPKK